MIKFGFEIKSYNSNKYYEKNGYILVFNLGVCEICTIVSDQIIMTNLFIETIDDLLRHYKENTGKNLSVIIK